MRMKLKVNTHFVQDPFDICLLFPPPDIPKSPDLYARLYTRLENTICNTYTWELQGLWYIFISHISTEVVHKWTIQKHEKRMKSVLDKRVDSFDICLFLLQTYQTYQNTYSQKASRSIGKGVEITSCEDFECMVSECFGLIWTTRRDVWQM